jgi:hypothetical protein
MIPDQRIAARTAWLAPAALAAAVWFPILRNYFHFDDFLELYQLRNYDALHFYLQMYGGHLRIVRNAVTAALDGIFGPDPRPFFALMLATHVANTILVYVLALQWCASWRLAVVAAALWAIAPANEGAIGWYAVYGQVGATTCALLVVNGMSRVDAAAPPRWGPPLRWAALLMAAGMMFGVGIAAALVMPVIAWLLLPPGAMRRRTLIATVAAAVAVLGIYAVVRALEAPLFGAPMVETTLMLAGVAPNAAFRHVSLLGALLGYGCAALPLGPLLTPAAFPTVGHGVTIAIVAALLLAGGIVGTSRHRRALIAALLLVVAIYGMIAIGRSMFISSMGTIRIAISPRFHYAAGAFLAPALAVALAALVQRRRVPRLAGHAAFAIALAALVWMAFGGMRTPINHFDGDRRETERALVSVATALKAAPPGAEVVLPNKPFGAVGFVNFPNRDKFPGTAAVFAIFYPENVVAGHPVVFTSDDPLVLNGARGGRRSATLIRELPP